MKNRVLVVAALGAVGAFVPSASGQVWAVQPAQQRIITVNPANGAILNSFAAPDALAPSHRDIGLSIAEGDTALLYHNSNISRTTLYRLSPITGAVFTVESKGNWAVDGMSWQRNPAGQAFVYTSHFGSDVHRGNAYAGPETYFWQGPGTPRGGLGGDGHGREFMIGTDGWIYEYDPFTRGVNLNSFAGPSAGFALEGLAFDGVSLYVSDTAGNLFTLNPNTGAVLNTVTVAGGGLYGLGAIPPIVVTCQPGDLIEGEFESGAGCGIPIDTFNGGCNSLPEVFSLIDCGQTVCGTAAFDGATRDTDWYRICVTQPTTITWFLLESEFDWVIFILDDACPPTTFFASSAGPVGDSGAITFPCLPPGCYNLFVAPNFTTPVPCPSQYRVSVECVDCVVDCQPGDLIEGEFESGAGCGIPVDTFNGGCNSVPEVFSFIDCGQTICGSGAFDGSTRDTDWYQVCLTQRTRLTWTLLESEFDWVIFILDDTCPPTIFAFNSGPVGTSGSVTSTCLPPGCYKLFVAPDFTGQRPCPSKYRVSLDCADCVECQSTDILEREFETTGGCGVPNDTFNGGCNSVPVPLYSPIDCGDVICGTAEFDGSTRDTDWYILCLTTSADVTWAVLEAEFDWVTFILDDLCPPTILASATGAASTPGSATVCVPAGCYALFVAPQFTTQTPCPSDYRVQVTCARGTCAGGMDCNENGVDDAQDIKAGTSNDCFNAAAAPGTAGGHNHIPDECECVADWNRDGISNSTDVSDFINTFFADQTSGGLDGDINCDGTSNSTDVSDFINIWFAAQAGQLPFAGCTI